MGLVKRTAPAAILLPILASAGCDSAAQPLAAADSVRLAVLKTGPYESLSSIVAREYEEAFPEIHFERMLNEGSMATVQAIERGEIDAGVAGANLAYTAFTEGLPGAATPFRRLRAIAVIQIVPLHLLARSGSGVRRIADLRGRRVGIGPSGSGLQPMVGLVLRAFGVDPEEMQVESLTAGEATAALVSGRLDAMFWMAHYRADSVYAAAQAGAELVSIEGPELDQLSHDFPFFRPVSIPGGSYPGNPRATRTIAQEALLVCRSDLDERLVLKLTRHFIEAITLPPSPGGPLGPADLTQAAATPIPLHAGAARYYRERELLR